MTLRINAEEEEEEGVTKGVSEEQVRKFCQKHHNRSLPPLPPLLPSYTTTTTLSAVAAAGRSSRTSDSEEDSDQH